MRSRFVVLLFVALATGGAPSQDRGQIRECSVVGDEFAYSPPRIVVRQNDLVRITFRATDIPHSFTIDDYRIAKRAAAGQSIVFEFRADRAGSFPFYCSLTADDRCKRMRGEFVVRPADDCCRPGDLEHHERAPRASLAEVPRERTRPGTRPARRPRRTFVVLLNANQELKA
jgi:cytochrome c oxidase subunit 2